MFRILSLDGGGIKGTFTASVLATLEEETGRRIVDHFDLITGTSTGGVIAIALGLGLPAKATLDFYQKKGPMIFPSTSLVQRAGRLVRQLFRTKHSHEALRQALTDVFGERKFGESKCRLVIPTYDAIAGRIFLMKTAHHERFKYDINAPAVDVARATSAAPTYFAAAPFPNHPGASYVDGGLWANCPVLQGLVEAVHFLKIPLDQIDILSVGTTTSPFNIAEHKNSGVAQWNAGIMQVMFESQVEAALAQTSLLLNGNLHRINITSKKGQFSLDDARPGKIKQLVNLGRGEAVKKNNLDVVKDRFLTDPQAEPFVPIHTV